MFLFNQQLMARRRLGITLTEILISIMILGVGMVSVATLFPIGLMRIRDAKRASRSTILAGSAIDDVNSFDLLNQDKFVHPNALWYTDWAAIRNTAVTGPNGAVIFQFPSWVSPFTHDPDTSGNTPDFTNGIAVNRHQRGLPVVYDPLFFALVHADSEGTGDLITPATLRSNGLGSEGRFGSGIGLIRSGADGELPPAHGLQRITNFAPYVPSIPWSHTYLTPSVTDAIKQTYGNNAPIVLSTADTIGSMLASPDDPVLQDDEAGGENGSPLVPADFDPDPGAYARQNDWKFSWMVTASQTSAGDHSLYDADIVIFDSRPFSLFPLQAPFLGDDASVLIPNDGQVVEAIWGYTARSASLDFVDPTDPSLGGYGASTSRSVLLRWSSALPDPDLVRGGFIADVTYERNPGLLPSRYGPNVANAPAQRIHWYRIQDFTHPEPDIEIAGHRQSIVRLESPVLSRTRLLPASGGRTTSPIPEAAYVSKYVVNVISTQLSSR